jgi:hypothetical protein
VLAKLAEDKNGIPTSKPLCEPLRQPLRLSALKNIIPMLKINPNHSTLNPAPIAVQ